MTMHHEPAGPHARPHHDRTDSRVTLRGPADLADALPYLLGYHPEDSIVLIGLHGPRGRVGGRVRIGIPEDAGGWPETARELADCLLEGGTAHGSRPDAAVICLCRDPAGGEAPAQVRDRLAPLAQWLRTACGSRDLPVLEALCISGGRYWSYCCPDPECCDGEGTRLPSGTSPMAAAAAHAGILVHGSLGDLERRLDPLGEPAASRQADAFEAVAGALVPRILDDRGEAEAVRLSTLRLAGELITRYRRATADNRQAATGDPAVADARDDALLTSEEAATLIIGLQDRLARDRAAEWMEGPDAAPALRLWRALARRCIGPWSGHAAAPLTLAGWVAWSTGDRVGARTALGRAVRADPEYVFGRLLLQALREGLDAEPLRRCMRRQRACRTVDRRP
ncbi:DUF4192 domain-containing protein [Streptomyces aidingensis]|uniref:DUF4192 domain-containing protein n=1 Tax=Streptomyces aidingensis TaxID=910347 RepID=A0A1I1IK32_9ACTN|nr:DUF4192 domain-containing protein [Streptomyces aidingensis]SFC34568.1 protein of unknown function [Streptomyces aidingensis]